MQTLIYIIVTSLFVGFCIYISRSKRGDPSVRLLDAERVLSDIKEREQKDKERAERIKDRVERMGDSTDRAGEAIDTVEEIFGRIDKTIKYPDPPGE